MKNAAFPYQHVSSAARLSVFRTLGFVSPDLSEFTLSETTTTQKFK